MIVTADAVKHTRELLGASGSRVMFVMISDSSGVLRGKAAPLNRLNTMATAGLGASLTWPVFCVDNYVAMTNAIGVTGDLRLVADLSSAVHLGDGLAWSAADLYTQDGARSPLCWRDVLRRQTARLALSGIDALVGFEMEFTVLDESGRRSGAEGGWASYGARSFAECGTFLTAAADALAGVGVAVEQIHAEYGPGQFEVSLPPMSPLQAADAVLLARTVIGRAARASDLAVSFSPMPFAGSVGNGAHLHLSFTRGGQPLLSGGDGPAGLTDSGAHLIAGILEHLPEAITIVAGSIVSSDRLAPGHWSGSFNCWGVENREAALRMLTASKGNPYGANAEVKCIDGAANPYLASGMVLGMAAAGYENSAVLPDEVREDPALLDEADAEAAGVRLLPSSLADALCLFEASAETSKILGEPLKSAVVAVRRHELVLAGSDDRFALARLAWSA